MFREKKFEEACPKYFSAINQIRLNAPLAKSKQGRDAEIACRGNLAQCKLNLKEYDHVIDQCERILEYDSNNVKAAFRMSKAAFALSEGKSLSQLKISLKYASQAKTGTPNNSEVINHYNEVKEKHDAAEQKRKEQ